VSALNEFNKVLQSRLKERESAGLLRSLIQRRNRIDFSSNDYLGFSTRSELNPGVDHSGYAGATGSRLISGNFEISESTEDQIARYHKAGAALIFQSGYAANLGLFSSIASREDTIISDQLVHASIIDGIRLSGARRLRFAHNDPSDLRSKLRAASGKKIVAIESVYSMHGDLAPLTELVEVCEQEGAILIVDEAHAVGVYGERGEGLVVHHNLSERVFACVYTYGKALGLHGAAVTGSATLIQYLINYARPFIYSTALPPVLYKQLSAAYEMLPGADREGLFRLIHYFRTRRTHYPHIAFLDSSSPIQGIYVIDNHKAREVATHLMNKGFFVKAILSPTVPVGSERIRICLHTYNTMDQIDSLIHEVGILTP
jgi:8-amino-7-oxononanoate synthase